MRSKYILVFAIIASITAAGQGPQPRFEAQTIDSKVAIGYGLAIGDVDGDKKPDILLADKKQFVWYRNGDWKRFVMIDSLTSYDNVCIAARDIDGDGKVEVAVGAQWNPGETSDATGSGSVHYLVRPAEATGLWKAIELHHEPTVHRMQWVKLGKGYSLVVAPLHGRGNKGGSGEGARLLAYRFPLQTGSSPIVDTLEKSMHLTHNFDVVEAENKTTIYLAGKEGIGVIDVATGKMQNRPTGAQGAGEIRLAKVANGKWMIATIEPMHGNELVVYPGDSGERIVLDDNFKEGHGLAVADLLNTGSPQLIAGWRVANKDGKVGIKLYRQKAGGGKDWEAHWIDDNGMACEDLKVADLDGDGRLDIIAAGRSTHNLKIYWNR